MPFADPNDVIWSNPYYTPPPQPDKLSVLGNMLLGIGAGMNQATGMGRSAWSGIGPGAMYASQLIGNDRAQAEKQAQQAAQLGMMQEYRRTQEDQMREKMRLAKAAEEDRKMFSGQIASLLGFPVQGNPVQMGPSEFNIGNVRPVGSNTGFQTPASFDDGVALAVRNAQAYPAAFNNGQPMTLLQIGSKWAPVGDGANDPAQWAKNVASISGLPLDQPVDLTNPQIAAQFARGVHGAEKGANRVHPVESYMPGVSMASSPRVIKTGTPQGPGMAQGDNIPGVPGVPNAGNISPQSVANLPPDVRASIMVLAQQDPKAALAKIIDAVQAQKKEDAFYPMPADEAKAALGPAYDPRQAYQRNKVTGRIETLGTANKDDSYYPMPQDEARALLGDAYDPRQSYQRNRTTGKIEPLGSANKEDQWEPLDAKTAAMYPGYDPTKMYQRNKVTGKIEPVGGPLVSINQEQEKKVAQQIGEQDAKRVGEIQANEERIRDSANKMRMATDMLKGTYTGPMADYNQALLKSLGAIGFDGAKDKASMAEAAIASINQMMPMMRAPGSGSTSDFEMRTFASALPGLLNTQGGNELIAQYYERIAERASQIRAIAEKHITEKKGLTGTGYADEIKKLGPLFSKDEIAQMQEAAKVANGGKPSSARAPLQTFGGPTQGMSPMPGAKPPLESFGR